MMAFGALLGKELRENFSTPLIYVIAGLFSIMMGFLFFGYIISANSLTAATLKTNVLIPFFSNMNFMFIFLAPLVTMRLFSEESKQGTIHLLLLSNLSNYQVIFAKYLSSIIVSCFILSTSIIFPIILAFTGFSDWGSVGLSYLGVFFAIMCYNIVGIFSSSLTENQIVSAFVTFTILMLTMLLIIIGNTSDNFILRQMISYLSVSFHFEGFVRGVIKTYNLVYYASFVSIFTYLTHKVLLLRKW